jgi:hypothetical protein
VEPGNIFVQILITPQASHAHQARLGKSELWAIW